MNFLFVYFIPLVIQVLDKQFVFRKRFPCIAKSICVVLPANRDVCFSIPFLWQNVPSLPVYDVLHIPFSFRTAFFKSLLTMVSSSCIFSQRCRDSFCNSAFSFSCICMSLPALSRFFFPFGQQFGCFSTGNHQFAAILHDITLQTGCLL